MVVVGGDVVSYERGTPVPLVCGLKQNPAELHRVLIIEFIMEDSPFCPRSMLSPAQSVSEGCSPKIAPRGAGEADPQRLAHYEALGQLGQDEPASG